MFNIFKRLCYTLIFLQCGQIAGVVNLDDYISDSIVETKQIVIPQYPDGFNPCVFEYQGKLLFSFRTPDPLTGLKNKIFITQLDDSLNPRGKVYPMEFIHDSYMGDMVQDPRFITVKSKLYVVYSNIYNLPGESLRRFYISEVIFDRYKFVAINPEVFLNFDGIPNNKFEKNWVPFEYNGNLLLEYTINPQKVFLPRFGVSKCETVACNPLFQEWDWGVLRGGTQAVLVDGSYLAFFHATRPMTTVQSGGKSMQHYFMGAYTFESQPPFAVTKMSPEIIVGDDFYSPPYYNTWKPLRVVFPCGLVVKEGVLFVSYGRQDQEMWIAKFDKEKLLRSLVPVVPKE
jgi:predicted GH43/DUF377 family glycosyl hydrolase